jgi:hypothetical protein
VLCAVSKSFPLKRTQQREAKSQDPRWSGPMWLDVSDVTSSPSNNCGVQSELLELGRSIRSWSCIGKSSNLQAKCSYFYG